MPVTLNIAKHGPYEYVHILKSYRNAEGKPRNKIVENHGRKDKLLAAKPNALEELRAHVEELNRFEEEQKIKTLEEQAGRYMKDLKNLVENPRRSCESAKALNVGIACVKKLWEQAKMDDAFRYLQTQTRARYSLNQVAFAVTAMRMLCPSSKLQNYDHRSDFIIELEDLKKLDRLYKILDELNERKDYLFKQINKGVEAICGKRNVNLAFYDVTTYAFESRTQSELRDFGLSKDHKVNEVQVVLGLVMDENGIPIDFELHKGNTSEFKTMCPLIEKIRKQYKIDRMIVIADRGLNSNENLQLLHDSGCEFIIAQKIKNASAEKKNYILNEENWEQVRCDEEGEVSFKLKTLSTDIDLHDTIEKEGRKAVSGKKKIGSLPVRWLVTYSAKRAAKDLADIDRMQERAIKGLENPSSIKSSNGWKSFLKNEDGNGKYVLNTAKIEAQKMWAGYYAVCTNVKGFTNEEVLKMHRQLWRIEDCFRISKTSLEARPAFVWTDDHIRGHFVSCYIALVLERLLEFQLDKAGTHIPTNQILETLREASVVALGLDLTTKVYVKLDATEAFDTICKTLGLGVLRTYETGTSLQTKLHFRGINSVL